MEDPLKIYNDILAIANEEFNEDKINRDSDGKFAPKDGVDDAGGDDDSSDDNKLTKVGGSNNTSLDKFLNLNKEEEEIEYIDDDIGEDEDYRDYLSRNDGFQNTTYKYDDLEVNSLSKGSQQFEYMIKDLSPQEQAVMRRKRFSFWKDQQVSDGKNITATIGKNYSNRIAIDSDELTQSIKSYAKFNNEELISDSRVYSDVVHQIEDGLKGSFRVASVDKGAEILINLGGFSPDGIMEKDSGGNPLMSIEMGGYGNGNGLEISKEDFNEFVKKNNIAFVSKKSGMSWDGAIKLNARDVNSVQPLMPFIYQQLEKNKFKIREQKKNYNKMKETEDKLSEMFDFIPNERYGNRRYKLRSPVQGEVRLDGSLGGINNMTVDIDTRSGSDPQISVRFDSSYDRNIELMEWDEKNPTLRSRTDPKFKRNKLLEGIFKGSGGKTLKEIEAITPIVKKQVEVQEEFERKIKELKGQQTDATRKHDVELSTYGSSMTWQERDEEMNRLNQELDKKTSLRNEIEPELEPEFEDIGDEEITNDDIDIDYDPRKIDLDNIDLDDDQAYA